MGAKPREEEDRSDPCEKRRLNPVPEARFRGIKLDLCLLPTA